MSVKMEKVNRQKQLASALEHGTNGKIDRYDQNKRDTTMHNKIFYGTMCGEAVTERGGVCVCVCKQIQ